MFPLIQPITYNCKKVQCMNGTLILFLKIDAVNIIIHEFNLNRFLAIIDQFCIMNLLLKVHHTITIHICLICINGYR